MSAPTPAPIPRRSALRLVLWVIAVLAGLLVLAIVGAGSAFYFMARSSLPQVDGAVQVAGISAPVTVHRDAQGVPHIQAASMDDLMFAQGYVTAQDRLWQMDMERRVAAGEVAEIVGPAALENDRRQRTLLLRAKAEQITSRLAARDRSYLDSYARGVNAYIESHRQRLPIEFRVLRYAPHPWRPADSLLTGLYMSEELNLDHGATALGREALRAKLPPELFADLYPAGSWRDHPPGLVPLDMSAPEPADEDEDDEEAMPDEPSVLRGAATSLPVVAAGDEDAPPPGSNNWVISGAHAVSGKPLLSNDTHLTHHIPNTWYEAQLEVRAPGAAAPSFDVAGFTLPGLPFVIIGHNQRIAWGFTNLGPDVTDLYVETFNQDGEYQTPDGWKKPEVRRETIRVKGAADVPLEVVVTRHGPIVSPLLPGEQRKLALKWVVYDPQLSLPGFEDIDAAQNWEEFQRALSGFESPAQNVVYGDVDGHIGYHAAGKIPIRPRGTDRVPLPGNDNAHEWTGYVPFEKLPQVYDTPTGILATANNKVVPKRYPYVLTQDWFSPYRAERIYRVLESGKKFAPADMLALQMDIHSEFDRFCAERFVYAVDHARNPTPRAREAAEIMRSWDGRVTADSAAPLIVTNARQALWRRLLEPKLGADWARYHGGLRTVALENILEHEPQRWLPPGYGSFDELLAASVEEAVRRDPPAATRKWGKEHPFFLQHPIFGRVPLLDHWSGPGLKEQSGSGFTVKQVRREFGPSERMTVDFSDLDQSTMNLVTGESGQILSPHYMDQFDAWYRGTTFPFPFSDAAVERAKRHELRLEPQ